MENIRFKNNRIINWARYNFGTAKMKANFAKITQDPVKLEKLAFNRNIIVVSAVAGNINTPYAILGDLSNFDHFRRYFEYSIYENMVLTPLAGNSSVPVSALGKLSNINNLYKVVERNSRVIKMVELAKRSNSGKELTDLASCPVLHVKYAVAFNSHTPLGVVSQLQISFHLDLDKD